MAKNTRRDRDTSPPPARTTLPDARKSPRFSGIATFGRYPRMEDVVQGGGQVDWAIYGVPFDGGVTYRPGARFGPRAIRNESQYLKRYSIEHEVDVCQVLSLADAGDALVSPYDCQGNAESQYEFAKSLGDPKRTKLIALGGDHSIAYANIKASHERAGSAAKNGLAVIHFDSHLDTVESVWGERWGHASVFKRAIEDGYINPRQMLSVGVKGPLNTGADVDYARSQGIRLLTHTAWRNETAGGATSSPTVQKFVRDLKDVPVYVTFDIDCVDPAYAPGTGTPSVGGFTSAEALGLLRTLKGVNLVGGDVVEVLPDRDPQGITALLAAHVVFEMLCLSAVGATGKCA